MNSRDAILKRLETFAHQHGLCEKREHSFGSGENTTVFRNKSYSVTAAFIEYGTCLALEVAREEVIGGRLFTVVIPVAEFARVSGDKAEWQEHDEEFQMRILESRTPTWFSGDHAIESRVHRSVRPSTIS